MGENILSCCLLGLKAQRLFWLFFQLLASECPVGKADINADFSGGFVQAKPASCFGGQNIQVLWACDPTQVNEI